MAEEIIGNYRLLSCRGNGQNSQVYEVVEVTSHRHFAMKLLLPEKVKNADLRRMLMHEAHVGKALAHPNVIKIVDVCSDAKNPYYVMEFFPAGSLKMRLMQKDFDFIKERAHNIFKQAATGLAYMNASGWVHRDVKPDNMLVNSAGELKLIDFALAQRQQGKSILSWLFRRKPVVQGTRSYMSPEQIRGEPLDGRADIYSFGCAMYEITTNRPPFRAATSQDLLAKHIVEKPVSPKNFNPELTEEFGKFVLHCLAKKPADRPETFHDVLRLLNSLRVYKDEKPQQK